MYKILKGYALPILTFLCGAIASGLQVWILGTTDEKGLLASGHIAQILLWILSVGLLVALFLLTRPLVQAPKYNFNFPPSLVAGIGAALAAVGVLLTCVDLLLTGGDILVKFTGISGFLCAIALALSGYSRWQGKPMSVVLHSLVCVFFLMFLVCQYRMWSSEPELQTYVFQLLATVFLMVGAYQRACFDGGLGNRRSYAFTRLVGAYFCFAAIPGSTVWFLYLAALLWSVTDLCNLTPMHREGR